MNHFVAGRALVLAICCYPMHGGTPQRTLRPETARDFDCYIQSAEARLEARKAFVLAESDPNLNEQLVREGRIQTVTPNRANPHKITSGQLYDWIGSVFIPGARLDHLILMLQDYDHRAQYFPETISSSKLLCRAGKDRFRYTMRMKEPVVLDMESEVTWQQVDARHWSCRSYSTSVQEAGKDHGYLRRLYSYWRFAEVEKGIYVESETITLSDQFGSVARAFGSALLGINPEKSLKHSLSSMRESIVKPGLQIASPPEGLPECAQAFHPAPCSPAP